MANCKTSNILHIYLTCVGPLNYVTGDGVTEYQTFHMSQFILPMWVLLCLRRW